MAVPIMTRSQRRMEKKQALVLLALILAVALVSFTLGVMVGKGSQRQADTALAPPRVPVAPAVPEDIAAIPSPPPLTFYDTLPSGEQTPLGSGINLPPQANAPAAEPVRTLPETIDKRSGSDTAQPPPPARVLEGAAKTQAAAGGSWSIQAASFRESGDARKLQKRIGDKGFQTEVQAVDLGAKGKWYRVIVGPFPSRETAERAAVRLQADENLSVIVRRG